MKQTLNTLFVKQFYRLNLGFFLVCFFILFGILSFRDMVYFHYTIMEQAHTSRVLLLLCGAWLLYAVKCLGFGLRVLQTPLSSNFLYHLQGLTDRKLLRVLSELQLMIYLPALAYAIITAVVQMLHGHILAAITILLVQTVLIFIPSYLYLLTLNSTYKQIRLERVYRFLDFGSAEKNFRFWLLHYLFHQRKAALLGIKIGSLILLQAMVTYNEKNLNLESVSYLMLGLIAAHAILPFYLREFIEERLRFVRAMPISLTKRYSWFLLSYAVLMLPELLFLLLHVKSVLPITMLLLIYAIAAAQLSLYSSLLYSPRMTVEKYMLVVAVLFFASILFLAAFPIWQFALTVFLISFTLFVIFYERWEATIN
ncbi:hypothetical protein [Polluticoccus soli]|uniref:hypothetical protein n=1 Tax=Polluticoccus soli TaxID=3034150 RepID=UPI0023E10866|nr:hypothetical protein [Flavipsychrobacter sp. JY13-12]